MSDELPDSPFEPVDSGEEMGGEEDLTGSAGSPIDRLFDGDAPGPQVGELKADYEMPQWMAVLSRGVMRVATGSGVPPIAEILIGTVMGFMGTDLSSAVKRDEEDSQKEQQQTRDAGTQGAGAPPGVDV